MLQRSEAASEKRIFIAGIGGLGGRGKLLTYKPACSSFLIVEIAGRIIIKDQTVFVYFAALQLHRNDRGSFCSKLFLSIVQSHQYEFERLGVRYWPPISDLCLQLFSVIKAYHLLILKSPYTGPKNRHSCCTRITHIARHILEVGFDRRNNLLQVCVPLNIIIHLFNAWEEMLLFARSDCNTSLERHSVLNIQLLKIQAFCMYSSLTSLSNLFAKSRHQMATPRQIHY